MEKINISEDKKMSCYKVTTDYILEYNKLNCINNSYC